MKASKLNKPFDSPTSVNSTTATTNSPSGLLLYEPTSVLDPHLTSSPHSLQGPTHHHHNNHNNIPPPSSLVVDDSWVDPLSFFLDPFDLPDLDVDPAPLPPSPPPTSSFDRAHLDLLLKAAAAIESGDASSAHVILSRLNLQYYPRPAASCSPLQRAAFHFKDALLSLLPLTNPPLPSPPPTPLEIVSRIAAHKSFSDLSPLPQFTSFTANQALLESLLPDSSSATSPSAALHLIDFDIGLGGQWSSFAQEVAARSRALRRPPPNIRITAVVPDETVETLLAADNLRDFARALGLHLSVSFVHVGTLGALALARVRIVPGEATAVVLTPSAFRHVGGGSESSAALLRFVRQASPRIAVFVDTECYCGHSESFRRSFAGALEFYSTVLESVDAAAGPAGEAEARRVEEKVMRPRMFAAVAGWSPREEEEGWREVLERGGLSPAGFSEFTESQAEWLLRRAPAEGFHVARRDGALVLSWRGRDLASTSAWRC